MMNKLEGNVNNWFAEGQGGKGGSPPIEEPDTLRSRAEASIVVALCEGEVAMYEDAGGDMTAIKKRIYLDGTPLATEGGGDNFNTKGDGDVQIDYRTGTQDQSVLNGFQDIRIEQSVGAKVIKSAGAVSATTTSSSLERIIVRMGVGSLFKVEDDGDVKADSVKFAIKIFDSVSPTPIVDDDGLTITGKSRGPFDREFYYTLSGTGPWTVRVKRITDDAKDLQENNDLYFQAIIGIVSDRLTYPNTAVLGMKFSASAFSSVPTVSTEIQGMKVKVPAGSSGGVWDGSFTVEYSNNPAWVFYDLLTNKRYGAGEFVNTEDIDIYSLQEIAAYCDEMVSDGKGGSEKRFEFNGVINNRAEAYEILNGLASVFRGMIYYAQGQIMATQDKPGNVVKQFTPANVVIEVDDRGQVTSPPFVYEGTALKARKTAALVSWNDRSDKYKSKIEYVEDEAGLNKYGYREIEVRGFGITSQSQARRLGHWTLLTNLNETETVTFRVGAEGFFLMPGEIIEISDPYKSPGIAAGLLSATSEVGVVLDREISLEDGKSYEIIIRDGVNGEFRAGVTSLAGFTDNISVAPSFTSVPEVGSPWVVREVSAEARLYRVISLAEADNLVTVLATEYHEEKYDLTDNLVTVSPATIAIASSVSLPAVNSATIQLEGL